MWLRMVKSTWQNVPVDHRELVSVVSIHCCGLTVYFDGFSNSSLESVIFPYNDQGGREVKGLSRVPEVITHSGCPYSPNVAMLLESNPKRSSRLTDVIILAILSMNFVDHSAFLLQSAKFNFESYYKTTVPLESMAGEISKSHFFIALINHAILKKKNCSKRKCKVYPLLMCCLCCNFVEEKLYKTFPIVIWSNLSI